MAGKKTRGDDLSATVGVRMEGAVIRALREIAIASVAARGEMATVVRDIVLQWLIDHPDAVRAYNETAQRVHDERDAFLAGLREGMQSGDRGEDQHDAPEHGRRRRQKSS